MLKNGNFKMHFRLHPSWLEFCFYQNRSWKKTLDKITGFNWLLQNNLLAECISDHPLLDWCFVLTKPLAKTSLILIKKVGIFYSLFLFYCRARHWNMYTAKSNRKEELHRLKPFAQCSNSRDKMYVKKH